MSDNTEPKVTTVDDDKIIDIPEAIEHFGLHDRAWREALKSGKLVGGRSGGRGGWLFSAGAARAYARAYLAEVIGTQGERYAPVPPGLEPRPASSEPTTDKEPT
jgi:hypothetical protein